MYNCKSLWIDCNFKISSVRPNVTERSTGVICDPIYSLTGTTWLRTNAASAAHPVQLFDDGPDAGLPDQQPDASVLANGSFYDPW